MPRGAGGLPIPSRQVCLTLIVLGSQRPLQHCVDGRHPLRPLLGGGTGHDIGPIRGGKGESEVLVLAAPRYTLPHIVVVILVSQEDLPTWVCVLREWEDG